MAGGRVTEVVEVNPHALSADCRREQPKSIEAAALGFETRLQCESLGLVTQRHGDRSVSVAGSGIVNERPVVDLPRRKQRAGLIQRLRAVGGCERWLKIVAYSRRPADMDANETAGFRGGLVFVCAVEPAQKHV